MRRGIGSIVACALFFFVLFYLFIPRSRPPETPPESKEAPEAVPPPEVVPEPAVVLVPRSPIVGRVLGADLKSLAGLEVTCGPESVSSSSDGTFKFPTAARPGRKEVSVRSGGKELARWDGVFAGDIESRGEADHFPGATGPPSALERIRWTVNFPPIGALPGEAPALGKPVVRVQAVLIEEWGDTGMVRIDGETPLPDGAHLDAALYFDDERVVASTERPEARGGRFRAQIRFPNDLRVHSATYQLHLTFALSQEDPADVERWRKERSDLRWDLEEQNLVLDVFAGDPAEEREENRRIESYYRAMLSQIEGLRRMLSAWSREARMLLQGWDPEVLQARAAVKEAWFGDPLLDSSGKFSLEAWRRFLDDGWRPEVVSLLERHRTRRGEKYRSAESTMKEVLERILLLSKIESVLVYQAMGMSAHPQDFFLDSDLPEGDREIFLQILEKELKSLQRFRNLTGSLDPPAHSSK